MPPRDRKRPAAKLFRDDIVQSKKDVSLYGMIARCWHDAEDLPSLDNTDPLNRPLKHGEFGVSWLESGGREILSESSLRLVDRTFQPGDFCKRKIEDIQSGVVVSIDVKGKLVHAISDEPVEGWKDMSDLEGAAEMYLGDYVSCDDWIGQVVDMFDECVIQAGNNNLVRLPELHNRLAVGDRGDDILPGPTGIMSIFTPRPSPADVVVHIDHTVIAIAWLAINQSLDPAVALTRERPNLLFYGDDIARLRLVRGKTDAIMRIGDRVVLKDATAGPVTRHGSAGDAFGIIEVRLCRVKETVTTVKVLWQDGSVETVKATELLPYLTIDEYDVWPGDTVVWKTEDGSTAAIVQSVNAKARTAEIRPSASTTNERVPLLELDAYGNDIAGAPPSGFDSLGVRRSDFVFIHTEGTANGAEQGRVPRIGEMPEWAKDNHDTAPWRERMRIKGVELAQSREGLPPRAHAVVKKSERGDATCNWLGEVTDLRLDGLVEVTLVDGTVASFPLDRLTKLYDGMDQLEDIWGDEVFTESGSEFTDEVMEIISEDPPLPGEDEGGEWEDVEDDEMDTDQDWSVDAEAPHPPPDSLPESGAATPQPPVSNIPSEAVAAQGTDGSAGVNPQPTEGSNSAAEAPFERFEVLSSAPADHAFLSTTPSQPSKNFMTRLTKEYRVLASSLPYSIFVRAYEDRADLLRCMIFGPENTPYEDAPFVIDWMLNSDFPQSPPVAHFHSWTNGNGRVNPNLYEEGKVCLSILGTWSGEKTEIWSAARSSLLQAFVSIQGLVLVKEPWFCEPAYEKLRGTEEGIVNSRLYSEKAYILSRNFVRRALELPIGGLEKEVEWFYYTDRRLAKVIQAARALIAKSANEEAAQSTPSADVAVPALSEGGIIMLERTVKKLEGILEKHA